MDQLRELTDESSLSEAMSADLAIIYKHSHRCPVSVVAMREVRWFVDRTPDVPVYMVNVVRNRPLSLQLADQLAVQHKSPQVILLRSGRASADASHHEISGGLLQRWVDEAE